jgi:hypothetical protein
MTDNITLPRAVVEQVRDVLRELASEYPPKTGLISPEERTALAALDAALAEPEKVTVPMQYGWLCPACGRGNAPLAQTCPCKGWPTMQITCGPSTMTGGT